jgi:DnaJ-class molecular chaperone
MRDPFAVLDLPATATAYEIKSRYRTLCLLNHPDHGGPSEKFQEILVAYREAMIEAARPRPCTRCGGSGKISMGLGFQAVLMVCNECNGEGVLKGEN